jgi:hypothetical protein
MISVCIPYNIKRYCTVSKARIIICSVWILSFVFGFFNAIYTYTVFYPDKTVCYFEENDLVEFGNFYVWFIVTMDMFLPWIILLISSVIVIIFLYKGMTDVSKSKTSQKKNATIIIIVANVIFLTTNIPYSVFVIYITSIKGVVSLEEYLYFATIEQILLICKDLNCALNFYMYFLAGSTFRRQSKELLLGCFLPLRRQIQLRRPFIKSAPSSDTRTTPN